MSGIAYTQIPSKFYPLFWDVDIDKLSMKEHSRFIIERILEKGRFEQTS